MAHESPHLRYDNLPVERRTYRNALEDVGTPEHPHDANLCEDYGGESEPRHGETRAAYRADGKLYLSSDLMNLKKQNTMKREIITIDEYGRLNIPTDTVSVWMTEAEIVELFGTTAGAVHTGVKAIFKENVLHDYDVCKCIRLDSGNSADVYNMEVVIAHAFQHLLLYASF